MYLPPYIQAKEERYESMLQTCAGTHTYLKPEHQQLFCANWNPFVIQRESEVQKRPYSLSLKPRHCLKAEKLRHQCYDITDKCNLFNADFSVIF